MGNEQNYGQDQGVKQNNERKGRGLFYAVIAVATFIIMAVGATFAYFTATTSSGSSSVQTGSTTLQLKYISYGSGWMNSDLIPADTTVVEYSFENQNDTTMVDETLKNNALCKDDFGNSICSVYVFQVYNGANSPQSVSIDVLSENNGFYNLNAMAYELNIPTETTALESYNSSENHNGLFDPKFRKGNEEDGTENLITVMDGLGNVLDEGTDVERNQYTPVYVNRNGAVKTLLKYTDPENSERLLPSIDRKLATVDDRDLRPSDNHYPADESNRADRLVSVASNIEIPGGGMRTFALVLYIKNFNSDQTELDAAKTFSGQVIVGSGDGSTGVSGSIEAALREGVSEGLQSNQTEPETP